MKKKKLIVMVFSALLMMFVLYVSVTANTDKGEFSYGENYEKKAQYTLDGSLTGVQITGTTSCSAYGDSLTVSVSATYYDTVSGQRTNIGNGSGGSQGGCTTWVFKPYDTSTAIYVWESANSIHKASDWAHSGYGYGHIGF